MDIDRRTLTLAAPALSTLGATIGFLSALRHRNGIIAATLGLIGSLAWATAAFQDDLENRSDPEIA